MEALPITGSFPYPDVVLKIVLALGIGLVVGLEREWAHKQVGARTFAITTLLGTLTALLARELLIAALVAVVLLVALMSFVIYPLLPDRFVDPWRLINPRQAWVTVVVIAGIGFLNYVLLRLYSMQGLYYAALLGGLVNSTAAVVELSAALKGVESRSTNRAVAVILLTNVAMFLRNLIILAIFAWSAVPTAFPPLALMALLTILFAWWPKDRGEMPRSCSGCRPRCRFAACWNSGRCFCSWPPVARWRSAI